ncbi:MAG TPA: HGGxSTG domain-containing protein [Vicinamibacteria bacterium]|jgi:hypothetical protein|nr:HGGxSTG domain-containing protein [Vicinamibacteria bacterium]
MSANPFALARTCRATNRAGQRCGRPPMLGGFVCRLHGGASPQAIRSARERLRAMVDPALDALLRIIEAPHGLCPLCQRSDDMSAVTKAAIAVLDRAGHGPHATLALERSPEPPLPWPALTEPQMDTVKAGLAAVKAVAYLSDEEAAALRAIGEAVTARIEAAKEAH